MARWFTKIFLTLVFVAAASPLVAQGDTTKIGVFDPEIIWKQTEVGKKYNQDLSAARDRLQGQIDKKQEDVEALKSRLRQQQASLNDDKIQEMKKEIIGKQTELDRLNEDATKEMKYQLGEMQGRFQEMLVKTLETYGKEKAFTVILNRDVVYYSAATIDISQDLIAKFNEMYKASAAPAAGAKKPPDKDAPKP